jgi:hypothetical protein
MYYGSSGIVVKAFLVAAWRGTHGTSEHLSNQGNISLSNIPTSYIGIIGYRHIFTVNLLLLLR